MREHFGQNRSLIVPRCTSFSGQWGDRFPKTIPNHQHVSTIAWPLDDVIAVCNVFTDRTRHLRVFLSSFGQEMIRQELNTCEYSMEWGLEADTEGVLIA